MFLEDTRPANDRALEVPREMRLSLLRWDYPEDEKQEPGTAAASTSERIAANSRSAGRPSPSLASREGGGAETADGLAGDDQ